MAIVYAVIGLLLGSALGYQGRQYLVSTRVRNAEEAARKILDEAELEKKAMIISAKDEAIKIAQEAKEEEKKRRDYLTQIEQKMLAREDSLEQKNKNLDQEKDRVREAELRIAAKQKELEEVLEQQKQELAKVSRLSQKEAQEIVLKNVEKDMSAELVKRIKQMEDEARETAETKAKELVVNVIDRYAADFTAEYTVLSVQLPNDEMKGRIIGKEGRNIQAFEKAAGVDLLVDETPGMVTISSFDTVRRHIAKRALEKMIYDGRIHPARIEEMVEKAKKEINDDIKAAGEKAVYDLNLNDIHPDLIKILGRLKYRTSYGQNQLDHAVEVAKIADMIAAEIGADTVRARKAALFHDIGKAMSQEMGASHVDIGRDIAIKYGFDEAIINAMESNHEGVEAQTIEAIIVRAADAISASRPGVRRESVENYVKRLKELESVASSFDGVEKAFAIQAGREVRIIVKPEKVDDYQSIKLASSIAAKIKKDLIYPGNIKVNVIRETRAVDYA